MNDLQHCLDYLNTQHVLTLCAHDSEQIWAANCFYVLDAENIGFWLMTEVDSLHGGLMSSCPQVAGTVSDQTESISELKGIQFRGEIILAQDEDYFVGLDAYQQRFPIAKKKVAPLWLLRIDQLKMTDNSLGFGHKLHWQRTDRT